MFGALVGELLRSGVGKGVGIAVGSCCNKRRPVERTKSSV